jgi:hypothetical protein
LPHPAKLLTLWQADKYLVEQAIQLLVTIALVINTLGDKMPSMLRTCHNDASSMTEMDSPKTGNPGDNNTDEQ